VARSAATSSPRGVSIATGIGQPLLSPASASIARSVWKPLTDSVIRVLAIRVPSSSTSAMSWCFSAQSMPHMTFNMSSHVEVRAGPALIGITRRHNGKARWPDIR
jgi:hypothetical protein